jgi:hypothetical protein
VSSGNCCAVCQFIVGSSGTTSRQVLTDSSTNTSGYCIWHSVHGNAVTAAAHQSSAACGICVQALVDCIHYSPAHVRASLHKLS